MFGTLDKLILEQGVLLGESLVLKLLLIFQIVEARQILLHLGLFDQRFLQVSLLLLQIRLEFGLEFFFLLAFCGLHARLFRLYLTLHFFIELTHMLIVTARFASVFNFISFMILFFLVTRVLMMLHLLLQGRLQHVEFGFGSSHLPGYVANKILKRTHHLRIFLSQTQPDFFYIHFTII